MKKTSYSTESKARTDSAPEKSDIADLGLVFIDDRDQNRYNVFRLGDSLWFAENLRHLVLYDAFSYDDCSKHLRTYGYLYLSDAAELLCPKNWKLPSIQEWRQLYVAWKEKFHDLRFTEFMSGSALDETGVLPMGGIGKLAENSDDRPQYFDIGKAASFWTSSFDKEGNRLIFCIEQDGSSAFSSSGRELCSVRFISNHTNKEG